MERTPVDLRTTTPAALLQGNWSDEAIESIDKLHALTRKDDNAWCPFEGKGASIKPHEAGLFLVQVDRRTNPPQAELYIATSDQVKQWTHSVAQNVLEQAAMTAMKRLSLPGFLRCLVDSVEERKLRYVFSTAEQAENYADFLATSGTAAKWSRQTSSVFVSY